MRPKGMVSMICATAVLAALGCGRPGMEGRPLHPPPSGEPILLATGSGESQELVAALRSATIHARTRIALEAEREIARLLTRFLAETGQAIDPRLASEADEICRRAARRAGALSQPHRQEIVLDRAATGAAVYRAVVWMEAGGLSIQTTVIEALGGAEDLQATLRGSSSFRALEASVR